MQPPQQNSFTFANEAAPVPGQPTDPQREKRLLLLMAQAIAAVMNNPTGDNHESA